MDWIIEAQQVKRAFGRFEAIRGIDLRIRPGETYGLIGPNGAGKTTLIRMFVGLLRPTAGRVVVLGHEMPDKVVLSQVGYMTQARAIYNAAKGRTTLIITHRLSQIRWADLIIVMRKGEVAAVGTHEDLLRTSEAYRRIFTE